MSTIESMPRSIKSPVLVLGATDGLGLGLVEAVLEAGYPAVGVDDDAGALDGLRERFAAYGKLATFPGSTGSDADAANLVHRLRELPVQPLAAIVNLPVTCERGLLLEHDSGFLERILHREVIPQLTAARHLLPLLAESGRVARYLVIGGPNADTSWVGYGHHSIAAAATRMLVRALRRETSESPVRVQQLVIGKPVRTEANAHRACPEWPDALSVGRHAARMLAGGDTSEAVVRFEPAAERPAVEIARGRTISS